MSECCNHTFRVRTQRVVVQDLCACLVPAYGFHELACVVRCRGMPSKKTNRNHQGFPSNVRDLTYECLKIRVLALLCVFGAFRALHSPLTWVHTSTGYPPATVCARTRLSPTHLSVHSHSLFVCSTLVTLNLFEQLYCVLGHAHSMSHKIKNALKSLSSVCSPT